MKKWIGMLGFVLIISLLSACGGGEPAAVEKKTKIKLGYNVWVGSAGVFVADAKGYFQEQGLDVELVEFANPTEAAQALLSEQVDITITTLDTLVVLKGSEDEENPLNIFHALDVSNGADGIIAKAEIESLADLKGKNVAATVGAVNHFLLNYALKEVGLTDADVNLINMDPDAAGAALISGQVDAAVTWEPFLSEAQAQGDKLLYSTADAPGVIVDVMATSEKMIKEHSDELKKLVDAIDQGVEAFQGEEEGTAKIVGEVIGVEAQEVGLYMDGIELFKKAEAEELLITNQSETEKMIKEISAFFVENEHMEKEIDPTTVINPLIFE
ncbi:ABC transporter substrate-binding protein [Metabacillus litoralis]|uniref:ABC transporter substrate-binding protein n=1 Tax=Metabacillus litoralis TaxID=152268 RepID=UPI000EF56261|nr:ABC transporter substrate-binding protein [Metabacillus litoralis]